jgi:hypothetical protein
MATKRRSKPKTPPRKANGQFRKRKTARRGRK